MIITVQCINRDWHLQHPQHADPIVFDTGAAAFDAASAYAQEHHRRTGASTAVHVEAFTQRVEVLRIG